VEEDFQTKLDTKLPEPKIISVPNDCSDKIRRIEANIIEHSSQLVNINDKILSSETAISELEAKNEALEKSVKCLEGQLNGMTPLSVFENLYSLLHSDKKMEGSSLSGKDLIFLKELSERMNVVEGNTKDMQNLCNTFSSKNEFLAMSADLKNDIKERAQKSQVYESTESINKSISTSIK